MSATVCSIVIPMYNEESTKETYYRFKESNGSETESYDDICK